MTLETFFEKFDHFAATPNFVAKMRELVLQLAVQGKLVPQNVNEEPAETMLYRIASTTKSRFHSKGSIDEFEPPFEIPSGWMWVKLPHVLKKLTDGTHHSPPNGPSGSGDFKYVTAKNIKTEGILLDNITYVSKQVHEEIYSRCDPSVGDVLYIKDGATTGIATINQLTEPFSMLSSVALLKPSEAIFNRYLLWAMRSPFFYDETRGAMKGAAITRVTLSVIAASVLPLPPLAEQHRIVAKVDELMALCDQLEAQQRERDTQQARCAHAAVARFATAPTPANIEFLFHKSYAVSPTDLRKTILQAAFDGILTTPSRSASSPRPATIPTGWALRDIASLCVIEDGDRGSAYPKKQEFYESGYCVFLNTKNVRLHGFDFTLLEWISKEKHHELRKGTLVRGDVVFTSRGTIGNIAHYDDSVPFDVMRINSGMFILRGFEKHMEASFLSWLLRAPQIRSQIDGLQSGSAQPQLPIREFKKFTAKIPPLAEQRRIVAKVHQLIAVVDQLEAQLAASRTTATTLMETVVAEFTEVRTR